MPKFLKTGLKLKNTAHFKGFMLISSINIRVLVFLRSVTFTWNFSILLSSHLIKEYSKTKSIWNIIKYHLLWPGLSLCTLTTIQYEIETSAAIWYSDSIWSSRKHIWASYKAGEFWSRIYIYLIASKCVPLCVAHFIWKCQYPLHCAYKGYTSVQKHPHANFYILLKFQRLASLAH